MEGATGDEEDYLEGRVEGDRFEFYHTHLNFNVCTRDWGKKALLFCAVSDSSVWTKLTLVTKKKRNAR